MFVLKNAWTAMMRHKTRTVLILLVSLIVSACSMFGMSARYSYESAVGPIYQALAPNAQVSVDRARVMASKGVSDEKQVDWNEYNISWSTWSKYAEALDGVNVSFTPEYDETAVVPSAEGQLQPVNGSNFTVTGFYDAGSSQNGPLGAYTVVDGEDLGFDQTTLTNALIPKSMADKNGTKVGDTINLAIPSDTSKTFPLKVVGIYTNNTDASQATPLTGNDIDPDNAIYVSYYTFGTAALTPTDETNNQNALNITFKLNSLADYETFKTTIRQAGLSDDYDIAAPKVTAYENDIQPLKALGEKLTPALIALWSAGGVLLALLLAWTLARRGEEIGYDITMGVSKPRIGWQFALEMLLPGLVGVLVGYLGAGFGTAPIVAKLTTQVHGWPLGNTIWPCIWGALGVMCVVAIVCWFRSGLYRTSTLLAARDGSAAQTSADATSDAGSDAKEA
ncbi:hypothetical protein G1C96_1204 [Bifidobacterium sp. DSM 109958]|uniref:ABC transporter permease n=1 Tax=Bifidobacterium moraviense TaxID=2675323 RepID=A0A7Y0HZV3_9BIFI|nr:ABC transporter permease [Bifidobacterium sp. DSM 109958]NMN00625.1 hypothetical protein [Bifidobacterium sp. DSM 109958]